VSAFRDLAETHIQEIIVARQRYDSTHDDGDIRA